MHIAIVVLCIQLIMLTNYMANGKHLKLNGWYACYELGSVELELQPVPILISYFMSLTSLFNVFMVLSIRAVGCKNYVQAITAWYVIGVKVMCCHVHLN